MPFEQLILVGHKADQEESLSATNRLGSPLMILLNSDGYKGFVPMRCNLPPPEKISC